MSAQNGFEPNGFERSGADQLKGHRASPLDSTRSSLASVALLGGCLFQTSDTRTAALDSCATQTIRSAFLFLLSLSLSRPMAAPVAAVMSLQQPPQQRDEFASVFHAHAPHITSRSSSGGGGHSRQSSRDGASSGSGSGASQQQLSEQQLFDRIEEQLEQLDKKRLMLQQLVSAALRPDAALSRARCLPPPWPFTPPRASRSLVSLAH